MFPNFKRQTIIHYLKARGQNQQDLFFLARQIREGVFKKRIHFRGLIEFSNLCQNDCFYCGIRKSNKKINRYQMNLSEIEKTVDFAARANYGSVVFQSGEIKTKDWQSYLLKIVRLTKKKYPQIGITVSCGEQSYEFYKKLKKAGAVRYLLRIETANQKIYQKLHPQDMSWQKRFQCLKWLKELGFQVGTGVIIGLPGQTFDNLVDDFIFFKENEFDMYGLGPYVIHGDTPLVTSRVKKDWQKNKSNIFNLTLNFLALLRIFFPLANIAAATALDVFHPLGRIKALQVGANIIMPSVTPQNYRQDYLLYQNKPCLDKDPQKCLNCLTSKIKTAGLEPVFGEQGNSPFYHQRIYG